MGLDMYLTKKVYIGTGENWDDKTEAFVKRKGPQVSILGIGGKMAALDLSEAEEICFRAAYWRKANAIHQWFVDNCGDGKDECHRMEITRDNVVKLVDTCKKVLADHSLAKELLPTQVGFFFGSTDYDEWYFKELEYTVEKLEPLTHEEAWKMEGAWVDYEYQASW